MEISIVVKGLVKRYKDLMALNHFEIEIQKGELLALLGPNGCGKTTLINCMLGFLTFDSGEITVLGENQFPLSAKARGQIGIVPQELAYLENLTVEENIDFFCGLYISDSTLRKQYVKEAIEFTELQDFRKFLPKKLSGGLKRRLNIACGIVHKPTLIFFDEPTVAVDTQSRSFILEGIRKLNEKGSTIIYTTHYLDEVDGLSDRIVIMDKGKSIISGTSQELKASITTSEIIQVELTTIPTSEQLERLRQISQILVMEEQKQQLKFHFKKGNNHLMHVANMIEELQLNYVRLYSEQPSLDDVFLAYTGKGLRDR